jgi:rod shape-determining protein MreC
MKTGYSSKSKYYLSPTKKFTLSVSSSQKIINYTIIFLNKTSCFLFLFFSLFLFNSNFNRNGIDNKVRDVVLTISKPIYYIIELPFNMAFDIGKFLKDLALAHSENQKLQEENLKLRNLYLKSIDFQNENDNLKKLLDFKKIMNDKFKSITTRIYFDIKNPLSNNFLINIGTKDGIKEGSLVIGKDRTVIGRIVNVRENYSDILLLTNINSNILAKISRSKEKILISGKDTDSLSISYFNSRNPDIKEGDIVFTSKISDLIPDGPCIGIISKENDEFVIKVQEKSSNIFDVIIIMGEINEPPIKTLPQEL